MVKPKINIVFICHITQETIIKSVILDWIEIIVSSFDISVKNIMYIDNFTFIKKNPPHNLPYTYASIWYSLCFVKFSPSVASFQMGLQALGLSMEETL